MGIHYTQLTESNRWSIQSLLSGGHSQRSVALALGVSPSTISREVRRARPAGFPLEAAQGEAPLVALLNARRVAKEIMPLVGPEAELDVNPNFENTFREYIGLLEQQILLLRVEAQRLMKGERARHAAAAPA